MISTCVGVFVYFWYFLKGQNFSSTVVNLWLGQFHSRVALCLFILILYIFFNVVPLYFSYISGPYFMRLGEVSYHSKLLSSLTVVCLTDSRNPRGGGDLSLSLPGFGSRLNRNIPSPWLRLERKRAWLFLSQFLGCAVCHIASDSKLY